MAKGRPKGSPNKKRYQVDKYVNINYDELAILEKGYAEELDSNPKYSLLVDPENKYNMSNEQKEFVTYYLQFRNLHNVAKIMGIERDKAMSYFKTYCIQNEIRRINIAMYHRQFATKMINLDEIGGVLTNLVMDNVPVADQLTSKDKIPVYKMLIDLNEIKREAYQNPQIVDVIDIETEVKDLSVTDIKKLINNIQDDKPMEDKMQIIAALNFDNSLSLEEVAYLKTLSLNELKKLLKEVDGKEGN